MVERRYRRAEARRCRRRAGLMGCIVGSEQQIGLGQILDMHEGIGAGEPRLDPGAIGLHLAVGAKGPGRRCEPSPACSIARRPREAIEHGGHADAILAGPRAVYARGALAIRVLFALPIMLRQRLGGGLEQLREAWKYVAKQA